jgi:hypothetical protein
MWYCVSLLDRNEVLEERVDYIFKVKIISELGTTSAVTSNSLQTLLLDL